MRAFVVRDTRVKSVCVFVLCLSLLRCYMQAILFVVVVCTSAGALRDFVDPELVVCVAAPADDAFVRAPGHIFSRDDNDVIACKHASERVTLRLDGFPPWLLRAAEFGYRLEVFVRIIVCCW